MIGYLINGSHRAISSDQKLSEKFQASLDALRPITLNLCSLKDEAKEYEFTAISIKRKLVGDDVENKSCVLSVKKSVIGGTLNISTPVRWIETDSDEAVLLDDISQAAIQEACSEAVIFIREDSIHRQLYSQAELSLDEQSAVEGELEEAVASS